MTRQAFGPFSFEPPSEWNQRASMAFISRVGDPATPSNILITHEPRNAMEDIQAHAWRVLLSTARSLPAFKLVTRTSTTIDGQAAIIVKCRWTSEHGPVEQGCAWIDGPEATALVVKCTCLEAPGALAEFDRLLSTLRFRTAMLTPAPPPPSTPTPPSGPNFGDVVLPKMVPIPGARAER